MPQDHCEMLKLLLNLIGGGREVLELEVPGPNFITQGVSLRRDGV